MYPPPLYIFVVAAQVISFALTVIAAPAPTPPNHDHIHAHLATAPMHGIHSVNPGGAHSHDATFAGHIPAHTTARMHPTELQHYAKHVHDSLRAQHHQAPMPPIVVAASHREGDHHVTIHTAPRGQSYHAHQHGNHPYMTSTMHNTGLATRHADGSHTYHHHAETAVLKKSLADRGTGHHNYVQNMNGHTVAVHGEAHNPHNGNALEHVPGPCRSCGQFMDMHTVWHRPESHYPPAPATGG